MSAPVSTNPKRDGAAKTRLNVVRAMITTMLRQAANTRSATQSTIKRKVAEKAFTEAKNALPRLCCVFEQEIALNYVLNCINQTQANITRILDSRTCPPELVQFVAPLCYIKTLLTIRELDSFISDFLVRSWSRGEVEVLMRSNTIPDIVVHVNPRDTFSLEELHLFVHRFEKDMGEDFTWFYERFPVNSSSPPDQQERVTVLGKAVTMKKVNSVLPGDLPPVDARRSTGKDLPVLPPFKEESYRNMVEYVDRALKNWRM